MDKVKKNHQLMEATIEEVHELMNQGDLTARELVEFYLKTD